MASSGRRRPRPQRLDRTRLPRAYKTTRWSVTTTISVSLCCCTSAPRQPAL